MVNPDLELVVVGGGQGVVLLSLLAFNPFMISPFSTLNKGRGQGAGAGPGPLP